ncbi:hypothetical protein V6N13_120306 [Hibiscus sabdariffa]
MIESSQTSTTIHTSLYPRSIALSYVSHYRCIVAELMPVSSMAGFLSRLNLLISGYGHNIDFSDALIAELWAIHDGFELAWNNSFLNLHVRSDCTMTISFVTNPNTAHSSHALVQAIAILR